MIATNVMILMRRLETTKRMLDQTREMLQEREQIRRDMEWLALAQSTR